MKKTLDKLNKEIQYQKIGDIYYPVFNDVKPMLGFYAKERLNFLREYHPRAYFNLFKDKMHNQRLFIFNCFCEQMFQKKMEEYFKQYPTMNGRDIKGISTNVKQDILNEYVYQTMEVIYDGKEFKITK